MTGELIVRCACACACGFEVRGVAGELIPVVRRHGRDVHNMDVTDEQVLAWLLHDDPVVAARLADPWRDALTGYVPEPFRLLR